MAHRKEIGRNSNVHVNVTTIVIKNIKMYEHLTNWFNTIQIKTNFTINEILIPFVLARQSSSPSMEHKPLFNCLGT
jgi:hypothetical protein